MIGTDGLELENLNPKVYQKLHVRTVTDDELNNDVTDEIDTREIFDLLRIIKDPEHPMTLEEIHVVEERLITVNNENNEIFVYFTPTIPHCTLAQLIGLTIRVQLLRSLPTRYKVTVAVTPGSHYSEEAVNKQLADKERVAAALENTDLIQTVNKCIIMEKENFSI